MPEKSIAEQRTALVKQAIELAPRTINKHPQRVNNEKPEHIITNESGETPEGFGFTEAAKIINGVHLDMYDFFDISIQKVDDETLKRLKYVMRWSSKNENNIYDSLVRLNKLMVKLGNWPTGKTKLDMVYNWIKLNGNA